MRRVGVVVALCVIALGVLAVLLWPGRNPEGPEVAHKPQPEAPKPDAGRKPPPAGQPKPGPERKPKGLDPAVEALVSARPGRGTDSPFFTALWGLLRRHGGSYVLTEYMEGRAVHLVVGREDYAVVVLRDKGRYLIPGQDKQRLWLLRRDGALLDEVFCVISNRLAGWFVGTHDDFRTDCYARPRGDGARLVIRYAPKEGGVEGNFSHEVRHGHLRRVVRWGRDVPCAELDEKGLCRVAIRGEKFVVLFPHLGAPGDR